MDMNQIQIFVFWQTTAIANCYVLNKHTQRMPLEGLSALEEKEGRAVVPHRKEDILTSEYSI